MNIADIKWGKPYRVESKEAGDFIDKEVYEKMYVLCRGGDSIEMIIEEYNDSSEYSDDEYEELLDSLGGGDEILSFNQDDLNKSKVVITEM